MTAGMYTSVAFASSAITPASLAHSAITTFVSSRYLPATGVDPFAISLNGFFYHAQVVRVDHARERQEILPGNASWKLRLSGQHGNLDILTDQFVGVTQNLFPFSTQHLLYHGPTLNVTIVREAAPAIR